LGNLSFSRQHKPAHLAKPCSIFKWKEIRYHLVWWAQLFPKNWFTCHGSIQYLGDVLLSDEAVDFVYDICHSNFQWPCPEILLFFPANVFKWTTVWGPQDGQSFFEFFLAW
jgi:hypothetical protein